MLEGYLSPDYPRIDLAFCEIDSRGFSEEYIDLDNILTDEEKSVIAELLS